MRIGHIFRILRFYIHWSKEATCLEIIEKDHPAVCKKQIRSLGLLKNQEWLLIADVNVDSSGQNESGLFKNGAYTKQHDQPFQNTRLDSKLKRLSPSE